MKKLLTALLSAALIGLPLAGISTSAQAKPAAHSHVHAKAGKSAKAGKAAKKGKKAKKAKSAKASKGNSGFQARAHAFR